MKEKANKSAWLPIIWVTLATFAIVTLIFLFQIKKEITVSNKVHERNHELIIENIKFRTYYETHSSDCSYQLPNVAMNCNLLEK